MGHNVQVQTHREMDHHLMSSKWKMVSSGNAILIILGKRGDIPQECPAESAQVEREDHNVTDHTLSIPSRGGVYAQLTDHHDLLTK